MYELERRTVYALMIILVFIPELRSNDGSKHQITLEWAHKLFITRVHVLFYFFREIRNP